jgi:hypothetical protein
VSIANDPLVLGHSDVSLDNFLYNPHTGEVWIVDCGHINVVTLSLASYAFHTTADAFVQAAAQRLSLTISQPLLKELGLAAEIIGQSGVSSLGGFRLQISASGL